MLGGVHGDEPEGQIAAVNLARDLRPDVVYHLAARSHVGASWTDGDALTDVNVGGTRAVVDACVAADVHIFSPFST